ncbi:hypothetical protein [Duganella sp. Root336D2]|uniref:hypothetical protein n=1 Tax=Duganella sp. Root336D2 TaxID=1736518 RepID=UPI0006F755D0|nr:hypothetical protein [Duganella sp. Root336D2]KQV53724.1 hypothetical protein ASD07_03995 [Duganella sp. Root336D2]
MEAVSAVRRLAALLALAACAAPSLALACKSDPPGEEDANTICQEHYPADAPRFEDYPVKPYTGPVAAVRWRADPQARLYRTMLKNSTQDQRPNFAGHFIVAHWGCGSSCVMNKIIDARTGKVFHPAGVETNVVMNIDGPLFDDGGMLRYRADSRLFILIGDPEEDEKRRGISFFEWTGTRMKLLRRVKVPAA